MTVGVRETGDHINRDMSPGSFRDRIWVERRGFGLRAALRLLTGLAAFNIGFDVLLHFQPPVLSEH